MVASLWNLLWDTFTRARNRARPSRSMAAKEWSMGYFVSLDSGCEGARMLGTNGYAYSQQVTGLNLVAVYRCSTIHDHFVSTDPKCEGQSNQGRLGYVLP